MSKRKKPTEKKKKTAPSPKQKAPKKAKPKSVAPPAPVPSEGPEAKVAQLSPEAGVDGLDDRASPSLAEDARASGALADDSNTDRSDEDEDEGGDVETSAPEAAGTDDDFDDETQEFPAVVSESSSTIHGRNQGGNEPSPRFREVLERGQTAGEDESELTETVVWAGTAKRDSTLDLGDDDDAVVSSVSALRARSRELPDDLEVTVNLTGDLFPVQERDDLSEPTRTTLSDDVLILDAEDVTRVKLPEPEAAEEADPEADARAEGEVTEQHLRGLIEALVFASDQPVRPGELARRAQAPAKEIKRILGDLRAFYMGRGVQLDEVGGAFVFRTNPVYAPFVRELTGQKPVKLTRTQVETLSILAYRQPITRPEIDDIRGVDSGPVLKMLLERDLIKILGKKDEPGRPILYGTTAQFLEFFGIPSLKDLPTLREFTELNDDSKRVVERELGESYDDVAAGLAEEASELAPTNELGSFEPGIEAETEPAAETPESRLDEALREIERAGTDPDDDDASVPAEEIEPPADEDVADEDPLDDDESPLNDDKSPLNDDESPLNDDDSPLDDESPLDDDGPLDDDE